MDTDDNPPFVVTIDAPAAHGVPDYSPFLTSDHIALLAQRLNQRVREDGFAFSPSHPEECVEYFSEIFREVSMGKTGPSTHAVVSEQGAKNAPSSSSVGVDMLSSAGSTHMNDGSSKETGAIEHSSAPSIHPFSSADFSGSSSVDSSTIGVHEYGSSISSDISPTATVPDDLISSRLPTTSPFTASRTCVTSSPSSHVSHPSTVSFETSMTPPVLTSVAQSSLAPEFDLSSREVNVSPRITGRLCSFRSVICHSIQASGPSRHQYERVYLQHVEHADSAARQVFR